MMMKNRYVFFISTLFFISCNTGNDKSDAYGNFEADETIISAQATGELLSFVVEEGDFLEKGTFLGFIDTVDLVLKKQQLIASRAAVYSKLKSIDSQIAVHEQQIENLMVDKQRVQQLLKDGAATRKQLDDIEASLKVMKKQIESLNSQKEVVYSEAETINTQIAQVEEHIGDCYLHNPLEGTVLTKYVEEKELVTPGKPLYKIASLGKLNLKAYISGSQLTHVKIGQKVQVLIDHDEETTAAMEGKIIWISDQAEFTPKIIQTKEERVNLVYAVKVEVVNDGTLKIGMPGEINFNYKNH